MFSEILVYSTPQPNLSMKRFIPIFIFLAISIIACNSSSEPGQSEDTDYKVFTSPDTVRIDAAANRDMMIILSILPDSIIRTFSWTRKQRIEQRSSVEQNGYFLDSLHIFKKANTFKNNHINLTLGNGNFLLTTYQIRDGHYVILTTETIQGKQTLKAYELYRDTAEPFSLDDLLGKYALDFMTDASSQSCLQMLYDHPPAFNYQISDDDKVKISIMNYEKSNAKGCLKGNRMELKFNPIKSPFDIVSLNWAD